MKRLLALFLLLAAGVNAQDFKPVSRGVEYAEMVRGTAAEPMRISLLRLDLKRVRIDVAHAGDRPVGVATTSEIAISKRAVAAVNAGFFRLDKSSFAGEAAGTLKIDGALWSESYADRAAIGIINGKRRSEVVFGLLNAYAAIGYERGISRKFDGINRERKTDSEILLYVPAIGKTPETEKEFINLVFTDCRFGCRRVEVTQSRGGTAVPQDGYVVTLPRNADTEFMIGHMSKFAGRDLSPRASVFDVLQSDDPKTSAKFEKAEDIVAGVGRLLRNGRVELTWEKEKAAKSFAESRHPRTAVAILKNGRFLMVTVDGRQPGYSVGMTLRELADFLFEIGAKDAINLDGGGSSAMFVNGKVVNKPSDKEGERRVSDAILVFPRKLK